MNEIGKVFGLWAADDASLQAPEASKENGRK
jgi:hypothetical protein